MQENKPAELDKELGEIKREVVEGRNLIIKTDNLLKNLHAELKAVSKRQEEFERRKLVSSGVAYVLFAVISVGAAIAVARASVSSVAQERDLGEKTIAELSQKLEDLDRAEGTRKASAERAFDVYRLMTERPGDERLAGVEAFAHMDLAPLSALEKAALKDRAGSLRSEIGQQAFERGKQAFRKADMNATVKELTRFMAMNPEPADAADASFFLGCAYNQLRQHDKAVQYLSSFLSLDKKSRNRDYAMLLLSQSYEHTGAFQKAADTAREALGSYPNSEFSDQLRGRLGAAKRAASAAGSAPARAAVPAPAAPAPAAAPAH